MDEKFDFNDISIIPCELSDISSRSEVSSRMINNKLPLIVSPMDSVVNYTTATNFEELGYNVCLPRHIKWKIGMSEAFFYSYGLDEIIKKLDDVGYTFPRRVLIDIANGHMDKLYQVAKRIKKHTNIELMVGNVANPKTYKLYNDIGVDWIRVSIGSGSACTTSANTSINYPLASLIKDCNEIVDGNKVTKIVADGGFKDYKDIIKALALGADSVMLGSILSKTYESNIKGMIYEKISDNEYCLVSEYLTPDDISNSPRKYYKRYRGMSTKEVQKDWNKSKLTTSEGIAYYTLFEYSAKGWTSNFEDYLKSAMSYAGKRDLNSFQGAEYIRITNSAFNRFNK